MLVADAISRDAIVMVDAEHPQMARALPLCMRTEITICCSGADKAFTVDSNTCINFGFYNDKITGIVPVHGCVKVWEDRDCGGASMCVCKPIERLGKHEMRGGTSWDNQISSMSKC